MYSDVYLQRLRALIYFRDVDVKKCMQNAKKLEGRIRKKKGQLGCYDVSYWDWLSYQVNTKLEPRKDKFIERCIHVHLLQINKEFYTNRK